MDVMVKDGQTLADIAVQESGTWEAAMDIAMENSVSLTDTPEAGTRFRIPEDARENRVMKSYCKAHEVSPATARDESGVRLRIFGEEFTEEFM